MKLNMHKPAKSRGKKQKPAMPSAAKKKKKGAY